MRVNPSRIELRIERVVLDGLPLDRRAAEAVRQALESELAARLEAPEAAARLAALTTVPSLRSPHIPAEAHADPAALGRAAAGSIAEALGL